MDPLKKLNTENELKETARLETFSDGVFAIAITLLILDLIQILNPQDGKKLITVIFHHWQALLAFAIGFLTILICWINHHMAFTYIKKVDTNLVWANGFVLLVVTLTPFSTAILAEYFEKEPQTALSVFGLNYFMVSLAAYCVTAYAYNRQLVVEEGRDLLHAMKRLYRYSIIYTFLVFFVCLVSAAAAIFCYFVLFAVFAFPKESARRLMLMKGRKKRVKK